MSQAEALLNSMSEEVPTHTHPVPDTDTYFIIDPITRKIENTNRKKNVIMQYDHNSERFTFELPRYIDGHDMLECTSVTVNVDNVEIGVEEPHVNSDAPDMTDLRSHPNDPDKVISSWLISRNSTQLAGILSFHIEYKCVDSSGNVVYEWSTDNYDEIEVRARKKNSEAAVVEHTDLLEQWRTRIFGAGDSVMANIAAEGKAQVAAVKAESETQQEAVELKGAQTLDTIPEDYTEVNAMADEAVRSKGDAIVCEAPGEAIVLKDSSNDHIHGLKLFGKSAQATTTGSQMFDKKTVVPGMLEKDGSVIDDTSYVTSDFIPVEPNTTYYLTIKGSTRNKFYKNDKTNLSDDWDITSRGDSYFTTPSGAYYFRTTVLVEHLDTFMMNKGPAVPYEPYTGGKPSPSPDYPQEIVNIENPIAYVCGKNLVDSNTVARTVQATVTTDNNKIHVQKTNTGNIYSNFYYRIGTWNEFVEKTITVSIENTSDYVWHMHVGDLDNSNAWVPDNLLKSRSVEGRTKTTLTVTVPKNDNAGFIGLRFVSSDTIISDETYTLQNLQVEVGNKATDYEPYKPVQSATFNRNIPGIPVTSGGNYTDENGQQWICDEIDLERGVHVHRLELKTFTLYKSTFADTPLGYRY
jgi:hypothetical protein